MLEMAYDPDAYLKNIRGFDFYCQARQHFDAGTNYFVPPHLNPALNVPFDWGLKWLTGWENPIGYLGARVHVIITPKREVYRRADLTVEERLETFDAQEWVEQKYACEGTIFIHRDGDPDLTGASMYQYHGHVIVPERGKLVTAYFSKSEEGQREAEARLTDFKRRYDAGEREDPIDRLKRR